MPYVIGSALSVGVAMFARYVGFDRDRAFYPTVLMVIASYYVLFAVMSQSTHTVYLESLIMTAFVIVAIAGFKSSAWILVAALVRAMASSTPSMATWWNTREYPRGGRPSAWPTTSERRAVWRGRCASLGSRKAGWPLRAHA